MKNNKIDSLVTQIKSRELNFVEEAKTYKQLIDMGLTQTEIADKVGMRQSSIANKLRLLKLSKDILQKILKHELFERHARVLLRIKNKSIQMDVLDQIIAGNLNVWDTEILVKTTLAAPEYKVENKNGDHVRKFVSAINKGIIELRATGVNVKKGRKDSPGYSDYIIRVYK